MCAARAGECDVIVAELSRRLGWGSLGAPGAPAAEAGAAAADEESAAFDFVAPNRYLFRGAIPPREPAPAGEEPDDELGGGEEGADGEWDEAQADAGPVLGLDAGLEGAGAAAAAVAASAEDAHLM